MFEHVIRFNFLFLKMNISLHVQMYNTLYLCILINPWVASLTVVVLAVVNSASVNMAMQIHLQDCTQIWVSWVIGSF